MRCSEVIIAKTFNLSKVAQAGGLIIGYPFQFHILSTYGYMWLLLWKPSMFGILYTV